MAGSLPSLSMSQTKDDLLKHLNLPAETYSLMAKEADHVYKWLTQEKRHLKKNCKRKPPYDWSDINEKSKDEAMQRIAQSGDQYTAYYWNLAAPTDDCPNWIARWFLYHKFRYRDGRNRNPAKSDEGALSSHHHSSKKSRSGQSTDVESSEDYYDPQGSYYNTSSMTSSSDSQNYYTSAASSTPGYPGYDSSVNSYYPEGDQNYRNEDTDASKSYYDPVRDSRT